MSLSGSPHQMFNLKWNNFESSISSCLYEQLLADELVDVTLTAEGKLARAHKLVLSACSPYFRNLFRTLTGVQHPVIVVRDARFSDLQALLAFIYQGEVQVSNSELPSLLRTAEALSIKGLTPSRQPQQPDQAPPSQTAELPTDQSFLKGSNSPGTFSEKHAAVNPHGDLNAKATSSAKLTTLSTNSQLPLLQHPNIPISHFSAQCPLPLNLSSSGLTATTAPHTHREGLIFPDDSMCEGSSSSDEDISENKNPPLQLCFQTSQHHNSKDAECSSYTSVGWESRASPICPPPTTQQTNLISECSVKKKSMVFSANASATSASVAGTSTSPIWKHLIPKPTRRMLPVKCPECNKLISNAYNLRVHMDLHKDLTYICTVCSTPTRSRDTLRKHITNIHKVKGEQLREMLDRGVVTELAGTTVTSTFSTASPSRSSLTGSTSSLNSFIRTTLSSTPLASSGSLVDCSNQLQTSEENTPMSVSTMSQTLNVSTDSDDQLSSSSLIHQPTRTATPPFPSVSNN